MADLERAINYVVETEISTKEKMDEIGLKTIYQMLENMVRYLPLRKPVRDFLIVLRDWPSQMEFKELSGQHYKEKVCISLLDDSQFQGLCSMKSSREMLQNLS